MISSTHLVAPEDIMAFLDGELSPAEAQSISAHLETCAECAALARDLRGVSQSLARWDVPPLPGKLEDSIMEVALVAGLQNRSIKATNVLRPPSRKWRWWLIVGGAAFATLALYTLSIPQFHKTSSHAEAYIEPSPGAYEMRQSAGTYRLSSGGLQQRAERSREASNEGMVDFLRAQLREAIASHSDPKMVALLNEKLEESSRPAALMIARTVNLTITVKDIAASRTALDAILARHQGYPAQMNVSTPQGGRNQIEASLRIPAPQLIAALVDLKTLGRVENESQSGEEVTQQHQDLEARLKTARETETRYQSILQQRTGTVADVLQVQQSIAEVRGNIEQMEAEQKNLEHRVDFASVELNLTEEYKASLASSGDSTGTQMHNAFVTGYRNATGTILGIVLFLEEYGPAILIWLVILAVPIILILRRYRRVRSSL